MFTVSAVSRLKKLVPLALCLALTLALAAPVRVSASETGEKVVRVGFGSGIFNHFDQFGRRAGYAYEYQQKIAAYTGWTYEYVQDSWSNLFKMLQAGELDLLSDVSYTEARAETMSFSSLPMGTESYYAFAAVGNTEITAEDSASFNGKKVGVNKNSIQESLFLDWAETNGVKAEIVELTVKEAEAIEMMERGELDAYVTVDAFGDERAYIPVFKVGQSDYYFAVNKSRPDLLNDLNAAMSRIQDENRFYNQQMYTKYMSTAGTNAFLSKNAVEWLSRHGAVRVGYLENYLPFCAVDRESGELTGALKEYLELASVCAKNAEISFETFPYSTLDDALDALRAGEIDCAFPLNLSAYDGEQMGVMLTNPFMQTEMYANVRKAERVEISADRKMIVAVDAGSFNYEVFLKDNFPNWTAARLYGMEECFRAVSVGAADCVLVSNYRIAQMEPLRNQYKLSAFATGAAMKFSFAVRRDDSELYYILNKFAALVSDASMDSVLISYSMPDAKFSLMEFLKDNLILVITVILASACLTVLLLIRRAKRVKRELEERLALQNRLLEQERQRRQSDAMITAMAADYKSVYYIDLDKDEGMCYRANTKLSNGLKEGDSFSFREKFAAYASDYVAEQDREGFLRFIEPENIRAGLKDEPMISFHYLTVKDGIECYEMLRMAGVRHIKDRADKIVHAVGAGFSDVDKETRKTMEKSRALSDALEQAEEANAVKTSFLNSMSHEIRTPMNAVIGLNNIALKDPGLPDRTRDYLKKISNSASHLFSLINSILDMSRLESGNMTVQNAEFSLREALEQVNFTISDQCRQKGLRYDFRVEGHTVDSCIGDETKLKQILLNILENAVKFTPAPGTVTFLVEQTARFEDNATLRFTIKDTGIGMDKDFLPRIFDTFSQEDEKKANKYGSTGLGMAIVKNIVEALNGKIEAESEKGVGSVFTVTVTLKTPAQQADVTPRKADLTGKRVLLVEDTPINAEIIIELLEDMREMKVDHAENGQIAVDMFRDSPVNAYDAILMDIRMPVLDGLGAAEAIRRMNRPDAKTIPIIAVTANAFEEDVQRSLQAGMNAHLNKPVEPDRLFGTLERLIR